jgi:SAM-dependent MidA family methyltransferase
VNLAALDWMDRAARGLRRGAILTLDYGYPADELFSQRHCEGTLLCFYRHTLNSDPYARIGEQDMTTHVDFTSLSRRGARHGLEALGLASQRDFLLALGMRGYLSALPGLGLRRRDLEANEMALRELLKADGLGRVQVLIQQRGLAGFDPAGLRADGLRPEDLGRDPVGEPPPLSTRAHLPMMAAPTAALEPFLDQEGMWRELMGEDEEDDG